jgi:hypothetical protein
MNLVRNLRWAVITSSILSGSALAADVNCTVTPVNSVITEGQTLQLQADCDNVLNAINWQMDGTSVTENVSLAGHVAHQPLFYTTPVGLGVSDTFEFTVTGTPKTGTSVDSTTATVVVKPSSAAVALAKGVANPTATVNGNCGTASGGSTQAMPTGTAQCTSGVPALALSTPTSFTWSCVSLNGGTEDNCYSTRGWTVTAVEGTNPNNGSVSPGSQGVAAGGTATINATVDAGYSVSFSSGCGGSQSGNSFTTGAVNAICTVTANYTNAPVNGACGSASNSTVITSPPSSNLCSKGTETPVASNANNYTWGCNGSNGGTSTSATACSAPRGYQVNTVVSGSGGSISAGKVVAGGTSTSFTVTPATGMAATVTGCNGGSLSGTTFNANAITGDCTLTASFNTAPTGISCNGVSMPGTPVEVATGLSSAALPRDTYVPVDGNEVYSFQITVPQTTATSVRSMSATKTTTTIGGKRVVISSCKGDYSTAGKDVGCYTLGTEVSQVKYSINYSDTQAPRSKYCHLTPGNTYWVNVSSRTDPTQEPSCTSATNCKFYFESN